MIHNCLISRQFLTPALMKLLFTLCFCLILTLCSLFCACGKSIQNIQPVVVVVKIVRGSMWTLTIPQSVPLYLLASLWGWETKSSPVLATRLNMLPTLTFSRSSGFRNMLPQIQYLLQAGTGQYTMCTLSSLSCPHSQHSCCSVCPSLYRWAIRVVWPVNSPTAALSLNVLIVRSLLALQERGYLISILDCWQPVQVAHLSWCLISNCLLMSFLCTP